jgi:hypothetical protein
LDRRDLIRKYKETPRPAGIYRVRNTINGRSIVGSSPDLPGMLNRIRFQLAHGSHPDRDLQHDWCAFGADAFIFETLDQLDPSRDPDHDLTKDLQVLLRMWIDKLEEKHEIGGHS